MEFFKDVSPHAGASLWNVQDRGLMKLYTYITFPKIKKSVIFKIPFKNKSMEDINILNMDKKPKRGNDGEISLEHFKQMNKIISKRLEYFSEEFIQVHFIRYYLPFKLNF